MAVDQAGLGHGRGRWPGEGETISVEAVCAPDRVRHHVGMESRKSLPPSGDPGHSPVDPPAASGPPIFGTSDAARLGLDRNSVGGAEVDFVSRLSGVKRSHRLIAGVVLFLMFGLPVLVVVINALRG